MDTPRPYSAAFRIVLFAGVLAASFGGAFLAGAATDPDVDEGDSHGHEAGAEGALRLAVEDRRFEPGVPGTLAFKVLDADGRAVEDFDVAHERAMHVIVARRDLTGYQHLHPRPTGNGRWAVEVDFPEAGPHRVFADFVAAGKARTLAADIEVAGRYAPRPLPEPATTAGAGGGYEVMLASDGRERRFTVAKDGRPVDDIEPYLGARGHLVALRAGDLAFQHVHPRDRATEGREIAFDVDLPSPARYRLFLQFKHDGRVHTAAFSESARRGGDSEHGDDHAH